MPTIVDAIQIVARAEPSRLAFTYLDDTLATSVTYGELDRRSRAIAAIVQDRGGDDPVVLAYGAGLDLIGGLLGCLYAGRVAVPTPAPINRRHAERCVTAARDCGATMMLTDRSMIERCEIFASGMTILATDAVPDDAAERFQPRILTPGSVAYLQYTSGSIAMPKGVMITHANVLHNVNEIDRSFGHGPDSVSVSWLPHFHDMGLVYGIFAPLYLGFHAVLMAPAAFLQRPIRWLLALSRYRATHSGAPNFAYRQCVSRTTAEEREPLDLRPWRVAFNGAEPVLRDTLDAFAQTFEPYGFDRAAFCPAYGLAEATLKVSSKAPGRPVSQCVVARSELERHRVQLAATEGPDVRILIGCGTPSAGTHVAIVDPQTGTRAGADAVGEIWVAGPSVAAGYWKRPIDTVETFERRLADDAERRFLRTGDLGFLRDGELFIVGRSKDLIILRGQNHYPEDIEASLDGAHPDLLPGACAAFASVRDGEERLVMAQELPRHYKGAPEPIVKAIRLALASQRGLDAQVIVLVSAGTLPRTSSGKIQRQLCRLLFEQNALDAVSIDAPRLASSDAPRPAASDRAGDETLRDAVARMLGVPADTLAPDEALTAAGLDSLSAVELADYLAAVWDIRTTGPELLCGLTIRDLLGRLRRSTVPEPAHPALPARRPASSHPVSFDQERLWLMHQLASDAAALNIALGLRLRGALDVDLLERCLRLLAERHEVLRTGFQVQRGRLLQVVRDDAVPSLTIRALDRDAGADRWARAVAEEKRRPFTQLGEPWWRSTVIRGEDECALVIVAHHLLCDASSLFAIASELTRLYGALAAGQSPSPGRAPRQYLDHVQWQRQQWEDGVQAADVDFWRRQLEALPDALIWTPVAADDGDPDDGLSAFRIGLPNEQLAAIRLACRRHNVTLFMWLLAVFDVTLYACTGQADVIVCAPTSGRFHPELRDVIGFCAYPLVFRTSMGASGTFSDVLHRVRQTALAVYAHEQLPFAKVLDGVRHRRHGRRSPLAQAMINIVRAPDLSLGPLARDVEVIDAPGGTTDVDVCLTLVEQAGALTGWLQYNGAHCPRAEARRLAETFRQIARESAVDEWFPMSQLAVSV